MRAIPNDQVEKIRRLILEGKYQDAVETYRKITGTDNITAERYVEILALTLGINIPENESVTKKVVKRDKIKNSNKSLNSNLGCLISFFFWTGLILLLLIVLQFTILPVFTVINKVNSSSDVIEIFGKPVIPGIFYHGTNYDFEGSLFGPKNTGTLSVISHKNNNVLIYDRIRISYKGKDGNTKIIDVVKK